MSARQGYYTDANSPDHARELIRARLSEDKLAAYTPGEPLDVQPWDVDTLSQTGEPDLSYLGRARNLG